MKNALIFVSVIVPVYKTDTRYLRKCIESLISQTCKNIEIILIDDGSPDDCGIICDGYAAADPRIKVIHQKNKGLSAARNSGMEAASGEYIMFVDSDDWIEKDCIGTVLAKIKKEHTDILCFQRCTDRKHAIRLPKTKSGKIGFSERKTIQHRILMCEKNYRGFDPCTAWGKLYKKDILTENAITFPEGIIFEDVVFNLYIFENIKSAYFFDYVGYHYRLSDDSITRRFDPQICSKVIASILSREAFVRECHNGDTAYERSLGAGAVNMLSAIERNCTFHKSVPLKMSEVIRISRLYLYDDRVKRLISRCRLADCKSVRTALRYILETKTGLPFYYICMKFIRHIFFQIPRPSG